jgi:hypothetical protein
MPHLHAEQYVPLEVSTNRGQHQEPNLNARCLADITTRANGQKRTRPVTGSLHQRAAAKPSAAFAIVNRLWHPIP